MCCVLTSLSLKRSYSPSVFGTERSRRAALEDKRKQRREEMQSRLLQLSNEAESLKRQNDALELKLAADKATSSLALDQLKAKVARARL